MGFLEKSWDSKGKMRGDWVADLGGVSRHIAGLAEVDLLGDDRGGLVDGGDSLALMDGGVRSRGRGSDMVDWVSHHSSGRVVLGTIGGDSSGGGSTGSDDKDNSDNNKYVNEDRSHFGESASISAPTQR